MKAKNIVEGGVYSATVSGKPTRVKVLRIFKRHTSGRAAEVTRYACINLTTNRCIEVKSAQRFRPLLSDSERKKVIAQAERRVLLPRGPVVHGLPAGLACPHGKESKLDCLICMNEGTNNRFTITSIEKLKPPPEFACEQSPIGLHSFAPSIGQLGDCRYCGAVDTREDTGCMPEYERGLYERG